MKNTHHSLALASSFAAITFVATGQTNAAVIAAYDFSAGTTTASTASTGALATSVDSEANSTAGTFGAGAGLVGGTSPNFHTGISVTTPVNIPPAAAAAPTYFVRTTGTGGTNEATTVAADDYLEFTVTPNVGYTFDLTSITFDRAVSTSSNLTGPFFVRSSLNYATTIGAFASSVSTDYTRSTITLSSAYLNLATATTFRIYLYDTGANANSATNVLRLDNVTLNGTLAAVPEPAAALLGGLDCSLFSAVGASNEFSGVF